MAMQARAWDTRERILLAAAEVFQAHGYAGAGLAEIIARSGVTRGAVYFHFASKADLAGAVIEHQDACWQPLTRAVDDEGLQGLDAIRYLLDHLVRQVEKDVIARASVRLAREAQAIEAAVGAPFDDWADHFAYRLRQAQLLGEMRPELDPVACADLIVGMFLGVEEFSRSRGRPGNQHAHRGARALHPLYNGIDAMWELLMHGLAIGRPRELSR